MRTQFQARKKRRVSVAGFTLTKTRESGHSRPVYAVRNHTRDVVGHIVRDTNANEWRPYLFDGTHDSDVGPATTHQRAALAWITENI